MNKPPNCECFLAFILLPNCRQEDILLWSKEGFLLKSANDFSYRVFKKSLGAYHSGICANYYQPAGYRDYGSLRFFLRQNAMDY